MRVYNLLLLLFSFLTFYFLASTKILAQTELLPGETNVNILPIILRGEGVYISGNVSYIAAYVQAYYPDFSYRKIGMKCYLNGDEFTASQNCSVQFYPEKGVCSILLPKYRELNESNEMKCKIYDPENPSPTWGYVNKTFTPINFSVWLSKYSSLVGEEFNFPVNIKNSGLFSDIYNLTSWIEGDEFSARINPNTKSFFVELHGDAFDPHIWNQTRSETKQVYIKLTVLDANSYPRICVNVTSSIDSTFSKKACETLAAKFRSMPELSLLGILFTILMAVIFYFKIKIK